MREITLHKVTTKLGIKKKTDVIGMYDCKFEDYTIWCYKLSENEWIKGKGMASQIVWAAINQFQETPAGDGISFWHSNGTDVYMNLISVWYDGFLSACQNNFYWTGNSFLIPKKDDIVLTKIFEIEKWTKTYLYDLLKELNNKEKND